MTGQTDEQGGLRRQIFTTEQEKPVSIFLPQHHPGRIAGPSKAVAAAVMATVVILGSGLFFMMPRGNVAIAPIAAADAGQDAPMLSVSSDADAEDTVRDVKPAEPVQATDSKPQSVKTVATAVVAAASAVKTPRAVDIPKKNDPRWARTETRHGSAALEAMRKLLVEKAGQADDGASDLLAYAGNDSNDFASAAAMPRRPMQIVLPAELPEQPDSSSRTASVKASVNMRKGPGSRHGVMMVIPRRAKVEILECDQWCKVGYEGRTGYIYKSFVAGRSS